MDSSFINTLPEEQLSRITPAIFDTLQKIIQNLDAKNQSQTKLLEAYQQLTTQSGHAIRVQDVIFILQGLQVLKATSAVVVEMDGLRGHLFYSVMPQDIPNLLGFPLPQCHISNDEHQIIIDPPGPADWDICIICLNKEVREIFKDYL